MKVNKIKKIANSKYKVTFDNNEKVITYDEVILKNNLLFQKEVSSKLLNTINKDNVYYDIYNKVISFLSKRLRSKKEVEQYIEKYTTNKKDKETIVSNLLNIGLINDEKFARAFINDQLSFSNNGPFKIKRMLEEHAIDNDLIEKELETIDSEIINDKIRKYVTKKTKLNHKYSSYALKERLMNELVSLGFDKTDISNNLSINSNDSNIVVNEAVRLYHKYKNKKTTKELYFFIKSKLYQKGFSNEEIDGAMQTLSL